MLASGRGLLLLKPRSQSVGFSFSQSLSNRGLSFQLISSEPLASASLDSKEHSSHSSSCRLRRRGRCGEYSAVLFQMALALGWRTRLVVDWTDHMWVEVALRHDSIASNDVKLRRRRLRRRAGRRSFQVRIGGVGRGLR